MVLHYPTWYPTTRRGTWSPMTPPPHVVRGAAPPHMVQATALAHPHALYLPTCMHACQAMWT